MNPLTGANINREIILLLHTLMQMAAIGAITALVWHGSIQGEAGLVAILGAAGLHVAGTHAIMASGKDDSPPAAG